MGTTEWIVVALVVGARLLLPLTIPYVPLVGVIVCLVLDAIDQSIFQQFPAIPLEGYQSYDKALDIYYLSLAYLATLRNWTSRPAFRTSQFLWYYRLVGVVAFELTHVRALLLIFANTFEYFFIFYEAVRLRWSPLRIGVWTAIIAAALIWVFIKLPQEWWIHIAQLDMTDFIKETLFGVSKDATWAEAISANPLVLVAAIAALALLVLVIWWVVTRKAPPSDHGLRIKADPLPPELQGAELYRTVRASARVFDWALVEKVALLGLVSVIFAQILDVQLGSVGVLVFVAIFVAINAMLSQWIARRGRTYSSVAVELPAMALVNLAVVVALQFLERVLGLIDSYAPLSTTLFIIFLVTVITVLFDRYRTIYMARRMLEHGDGDLAPRESHPA
jgi:hypothetical protein